MVQAQAAIRFAEVGGAVAPPAGQFLGFGETVAQHIGETAGLLKAVQGLDLDRRVADDLGHIAVVPDIAFAGGDIEIAGHDQGTRLVLLGHDGGQLFIEVHLMIELGVQRPVGNVAAGRDVEVLHVDAGHAGRDAARVTQFADLEGVAVLKRQTACDGDAVPALLARHAKVGHAHVLESAARKLVGGAFDLLQHQDIGRAFGDEAGDLVDAQADGVDVPGGEAKGHAPV